MKPIYTCTRETAIGILRELGEPMVFSKTDKELEDLVNHYGIQILIVSSRFMVYSQRYERQFPQIKDYEAFLNIPKE